jgi:tetratricopeptide (TPR) repeat protein
LNGLLPQLEYLELIVNHNIQKKTEVLILKAKILHFLNKGQESEQIWKKALENDHDYLATLEYCTFMASTGKSYPEELFDKAMRSQFIQQSYKADKAAEIHYFKKDYTNAKSFIETSLKQGNFQSIETLKLAVKIYAALGDSDSVNRHNDRIKLLTEQDTIDTYQLLLNSK